ncbi:MAG: C/D box methylation guide ribonucleoprotein complex aNOP56 subunit [Candidatus Korarchaeota archaeon]|nr:C/D box methylation guide ribonucleoprotein complex aNOP56 subunit [Candidatus Korarchaeota archaeon]
MRVHVVAHPFGILLLDGDGNALFYSVFSSPEDAGESLYLLSLGRSFPQVEEVQAAIENMGDEVEEVVVPSRELASSLGYSGRVIVDLTSPVARAVRERALQIAKEMGFQGDRREYNDYVTKVGIEISRRRIKDDLSQRDNLIIRAIDYVDHLNKSLNVLIPAIREWYSIYFPELDSLVEDHYTYALIAAELTARERITKEALRRMGVDKALAERVEEAAKNSIGADLPAEDLNAIATVAKRWVKLYETREQVEGYIEDLMRQVAPNLSAVVSPLVAARLIAIAGGLKRLASLPASSIQILGAQKAIFLHLTRGTKPPKHGVLFQAKEVRTAPKKFRGKIARLLASKIAIAARVDAFGRGRFVGDQLRAEIDRRLAELRGGKR